MKIKIISGKIEAEAELKNTQTAKAIYDILPVEGTANRWGDEIYFEIPVNLGAENDATDIVEEGAIAYWSQGKCFCIFFGKTPASKGNEIRAASKVNVFGKAIQDSKLFKNVNDGDPIIVKKLQ